MRADYSRQSDPDMNPNFRRAWDGGCRIDPPRTARRAKATPIIAADECLGIAVMLDWRRRNKEAL